jgi:transcriptional regulator with XRE-family HTH domain
MSTVLTKAAAARRNVSVIDIVAGRKQYEYMSDPFLAVFGATVRRLRENRGMTQRDLAERVGLGRTSMTNLERGNQNPPLSILPSLARGLGVSTRELFAEIDKTSEGVDEDVLATHVHDDALRSWASRLIGHDVAESVESQTPPIERAER